jgi:DNA-binding transcriptional MerR regulator
MYTIQQMARLAGITPRTLRHYHQIGLLHPARIGTNGYRYYDDADALRLQQILLYRELGLPLEEIKSLITRPDFQVDLALQEHHSRLILQIARLEKLVRTVEDTLMHIKGEKHMSPQQLFEPFNEEQQAAYEKEAMQMYDPRVVRESNRKWKSYSQEEKQRIGDEGIAAYQAIVDSIPFGADSAQAQAGVALWRKHMDYFWTPAPEQLLGLAHLYNDDPRFKANFDKIDPRLAEFMLRAVEVYVSRL